MDRLISRDGFIREAKQLCSLVLFAGLLLVTHTAKSEEMASRLVNPNTQWQPSYHFNMNVADDLLKDVLPGEAGLDSAPHLLLFAETKKEEDWSINIQKQNTSGSGCSSLSSLLCIDSKEERTELSPQRDSLWVVLRKAFHF